MTALAWFAFGVCLTAYTAVTGGSPEWVLLNVVLDVFAFVAAVKAMGRR